MHLYNYFNYILIQANIFYLVLGHARYYSVYCSKNIQYSIMKVENTQIQMRKGILEFCILHIISRGEVYASDMLEELTTARIMVVEGTIYPLLTRLRKAGLVEHKWVESTSGPPRKYYTITDEGIMFLDQLDTTWKELIISTEKIIQKTTKKEDI